MCVVARAQEVAAVGSHQAKEIANSAALHRRHALEDQVVALRSNTLKAAREQRGADFNGDLAC